MRRVIFIGETGSGKTTLSQWLQKKEMSYHKTQQVYYFDDSIDTPGEFIENRFYNNALVTAAVDAKIVALVQDVTSNQNYFPPYFSTRFNQKVIGIVSKIDLANEEMKTVAHRRLKLAGAQKVFELSSLTGQGLSELVDFLLVENNNFDMQQK